MDSLALLCNLYGDGPATVRRLREAGLGSLESIDAVEAERLAALLRTSVRSAQRFQAEGRLLLERTTAAVERAAPQAEEPGPSDPLLRKVLDAWRRKDAEESPQERPAREPAAATAAPAAQPQPPAPTRVEPAAEPLVAGAVDGLDAVAVEALARTDVHSLVQLARCEALATSTAAGLSYMRLLRLQLLARRQLARSGPAARDPENVVLQPAPPRARAAAPSGDRVRPAAVPDPRFSPAEGPVPSPPAPLDPLVGPRVDRRAATAEARATPEEGSLESAGPFA